MAINRLRQQNIFDQFGLDYGMDPMGSSPSPAPLESRSIDFGGTGLPNIQGPPNPRQFEPPEPEITAPTIWDILKREYTPETYANERFNRFIDEYPQREEPSTARKIAASFAGLGNIRMRQAGGPEAADKVLYAPHMRDVADWKLRADPLYQAASLERQGNIQERQLIGQGAQFETSQNKIAEAARQADLKNEQALGRNRIAMLKVQMGPGWQMDAHNGTTIKMFNKTTGEIKDTGMTTRWMDEADKVDAEGQYKIDAAKASGEAAMNRLVVSGAGLFQDETGTRYARNAKTGALEPVEGGPERKIERIGGPSAADKMTSQRKTMMEGAQDLLPKVGTLRAQAEELNKKELFGPIMSRIRELATKFGTTGDVDEDSQSFQDLANAISKDPGLGGSSDRLIGRFAANISLMASGTGRVHGGARGGGSIEMIKYMRNLLNANSSLDMFQGRMDTLEDYLKTYAAPPGEKAVTSKTPKVEVGRVVVEDADGKKFTLPANQVDSFLTANKQYRRSK